MKKISFYILSFLVAILVISGCRKSDNPRVPELERVPLPLFTLSENAETQIPRVDPQDFTTSFTLDLYYKNGDKPKQFDLVVMKNGDKANVKTIQANITSFPVDFTLTGQQLIDMFEEPIVLGDAFLVGVDVTTQGGKEWLAFPPTGTTYAPGISNLPGSVTQLRFAAPCEFVPAAYTEGDYEIIVDEWADFEAGDLVAVTKIDDTHYSFKYKAENAQPIIMEVDPVTNEITVETTMYGVYSPYGPFTAKSVPGETSVVDPCDVSFSVKLNHSYGGGDLGDYVIKFRKL